MAEENKALKFYIAKEDTRGLLDDINGTDSFKSLVNRRPTKFPDDIGEMHLFDMGMTEELCVKFGFVGAIVDRVMEYVWGPGFGVKCEDENALQIINDWNRETQFPVLGRKWLKDGLVKGIGCLELGGASTGPIQGIKVLDSKYMYVKRDIMGNLLQVTQLTKTFPKDNFDFSKLQEGKDYVTWKGNEVNNIIFLPINSMGDMFYGYGIIYPNLNSIDNFLMANKDMHTILKRKAGTPYHIKMGSMEKEIYPDAAAVADMGQKLTWLESRTEWVTGPDIEIKCVDFGNTSDKFQFPIDNDMKMIFHGFQTPETVAGSAVSTGLGSSVGTEHGDAFDRHIQSIQEEIEKVIETKIYKRLLASYGYANVPVEIVWGEDTDEDKWNKINNLKNLLMSLSNPALREQVERDIALTLGYEEDMFEEGLVRQKKEEEEEKKAFADGAGQKPGFFKNVLQKLTGQNITKVREVKLVDIPEDIFRDYVLTEWVGFSYHKYVKYIDEEIDKDRFTDLAAMSAREYEVGYLTENQVNKLKVALKETFNKGHGIKMLSSTLLNKNIIPDLYALAEDGTKSLIMSRDVRSLMVARTETIRMANQGALANYKENNVREVSFTAALSDRTCEECMSLDGKVFEISNIPPDALIPVHPNCRCTYIPVIRG